MNRSMLCVRFAVRRPSSSSSRAGITLKVMAAISSVDIGPHFTRLGGLVGLFGFSAELS